jgi:uncharacterized protein with NRDE domain
MCSIFFAWHAHPLYKLIVAANRDEFYKRPTEDSRFRGDVLCGKDLEANGSWMGITRNGRFAALTNYRDMSLNREDAPSRGKIVATYLENPYNPTMFYELSKNNFDAYNPFNLLLSDRESLYYCSNVNHLFQKLKPGVYGLSNHLLNTPWPKVEKGRSRMTHIMNHTPRNEIAEHLFLLLEDREIAPDEYLPDTGMGKKIERMLSPIFIVSEEYGTRTSTVLLVDKNDQVFWSEKTFLRGKYSQRNDFNFNIEV